MEPLTSVRCPRCGDKQWGGTTVGPQCESCGFFPAEEGWPYGVSFRMFRPYFDAVVAGTKTEEFRASKPYWERVARSVERRLGKRQEVIGVFFCGKASVRKRIVRVSHYASPRIAFKRAPTEKEVEMVGRGHVIGFALEGLK